MSRKYLVAIIALLALTIGTAGIMRARGSLASPSHNAIPATSARVLVTQDSVAKDCEEDDDEDSNAAMKGTEHEHEGSATTKAEEDDDKVEHKCGKDDGEAEDGQHHRESKAIAPSAHALAAKP